MSCTLINSSSGHWCDFHQVPAKPAEIGIIVGKISQKPGANLAKENSYHYVHLLHFTLLGSIGKQPIKNQSYEQHIQEQIAERV